MSNPTSNFGWQMPTATDLVTDLPADFEVFGQAVDTALMDLKGGTTGQVLKKNTDTDMDFVWAADAAGMTNPMTTTGDTIYSSSGSTPARLGIGSTGQVLTVAAGVPSWATPAAGPTGYTLLNTGGTLLTGAATITVSGLSAKEILILIVAAQSTVASGFVEVRFNGDTGANYSIGGMQLSSPTAYATGNLTQKGSYSGFDRVDVGAFSSNTGSFFSGSVSIDLANTTGWKKFVAVGSGQADGGNSHVTTTNQGIYEASAAITSISVTTTAGNFNAGTVYVLGAN